MDKQTITINGVAFVVTFNEANGVTSIVVPSVKAPGDPNGRPFEVDYDPAGTLSNVYSVYALLVEMGLI